MAVQADPPDPVPLRSRSSATHIQIHSPPDSVPLRVRPSAPRSSAPDPDPATPRSNAPQTQIQCTKDPDPVTTDPVHSRSRSIIIRSRSSHPKSCYPQIQCTKDPDPVHPRSSAPQIQLTRDPVHPRSSYPQIQCTLDPVIPRSSYPRSSDSAPHLWHRYKHRPALFRLLLRLLRGGGPICPIVELQAGASSCNRGHSCEGCGGPGWYNTHERGVRGHCCCRGEHPGSLRVRVCAAT